MIGRPTCTNVHACTRHTLIRTVDSWIRIILHGRLWEIVDMMERPWLRELKEEMGVIKLTDTP
jgi:hypothetical protein